MRPVKKIENLIKRINVIPGAEMDRRTLHDVLQAQEKTKKLSSAGIQPSVWRIIMKSKITKFAAAAVVLITFGIIAYNHTGSIDGSRVAWAAVMEKVEQCSGFKSRIIARTEKMGEIEYQIFDAGQLGSRIDVYKDANLITIKYSNPAEHTIYGVMPEPKKYSKIILSEKEWERAQAENKDPRTFLKLFLGEAHTSLGESNINGIKVEGIEVKSPKIANGIFGNATGRLWVNVQNELPVKMEIEGILTEQKMYIVMDKFEWDVRIDPAFIEPNIPADYTLTSEIKLPEKSEQSLIDGLKKFSELSGGQYPKDLHIMELVKEAAKLRKQSPNSEQQKLEDYAVIMAATAYYTKLEKDGNEPEYHGGVSADEKDLVLMKWKIGEGKYRRVYGDLHTDTQDTAEMVEMALKLSGKVVPKEQRPMMFRVLNLNEKDLIAGLAQYAKLSDGKYPSTLETKKLLPSVESCVKIKGLSQIESKPIVEDIFCAGGFYDKLVREKQEPVYYGAAVQVGDGNSVLIRWKEGGKSYRVIYGDLRAETVNAEKLAEFEKPSK